MRRSSRKSRMAIEVEAKRELELDDWCTTGDKHLAPEGGDDDYDTQHELILQSDPSAGFISTEPEEQGEGEVEGAQKVTNLPSPSLVVPHQFTGGVQGEMSELRYESPDTQGIHSRSESVFEVPQNSTSHRIGGELSVMPKPQFNSEEEKVISPLPVSAGGTSKSEVIELKTEQMRVSLHDIQLSPSVQRISPDALPTPGVITPGEAGVNL